MRILVLSHEYPPVGGGGGRVAQDISQGLAKRGHEVAVLTAQADHLPLRESENGVQVFRIRSGRRELFRADMRAMSGYLAAGFRRGLALARDWKPDLIHVHFAVPAGALAWSLRRLTGVPYVLTAHLGDVPGGVPEKTARWFQWVYPFTPPIWRDAARVVAVSEFTRRLALDHYAVPIEVIHNGIDTRQVHPGEIAPGDPPQVIFAGRFVLQKEPLLFVQSLARVRDLPWRAVMLGDGPLRPQVQAEIRRLGLEDRFDLPGWKTPEEVIAWFGRSDLLLMPSRTEGLPVVGVQALSMGLAIVASRIGGWSELVLPGQNGCLFAPGSLDEMEAGLRAMLGDPQILLQARLASRHYAAEFDLERVVAAYQALFEQVVAG